MRSYLQGYRATFTLTNGRDLTCEIWYRVYPATFDSPEDCNSSDPVYTLDDVEIEYSKLPKGLDAIADRMAEDVTQFSYIELQPRNDY